jgi:hypothetical protein
MWQAGQLVRFKSSEFDREWKVGLIVKYDRFLGIAEVLVDGELHYAPRRLVKPCEADIK